MTGEHLQDTPRAQCVLKRESRLSNDRHKFSENSCAPTLILAKPMFATSDAVKKALKALEKDEESDMFMVGSKGFFNALRKGHHLQLHLGVFLNTGKQFKMTTAKVSSRQFDYILTTMDNEIKDTENMATTLSELITDIMKLSSRNTHYTACILRFRRNHTTSSEYMTKLQKNLDKMQTDITNFNSQHANSITEEQSRKTTTTTKRLPDNNYTGLEDNRVIYSNHSYSCTMNGPVEVIVSFMVLCVTPLCDLNS
ncbi:hypothetical protein BDV96DRAFT_607301 [Lophiotrema nucula]|uniref:Uncharacterized protein n=1 Tax=Lophiotrema nucula TaxID=690887 RepID=A0A6A5YIR3_9PLEO|nr:hypothetical protein BDV96DRAFT_607301 [Lophiotrema nucula]